MARELHSEYGPESKPGGNRAECGGVTLGKERDVMNYAPPMGPKGISNRGPGLGGTNFGNSGSQGKYGLSAEAGGSPGLHGRNLTNSGSQGRR